MVKILSGFSGMGGSTVAFINLTNAFNDAGIEICYYGPNDWHMDKCRGEKITGPINTTPDDILIMHIIAPAERPNAKKVILSCHEQHMFPINKINYKIFDKIHYVSEHQKIWQNIDHPSFIAPNILDDLLPNSKITDGPVAGIIGSIDPNKQTHISVARALKDGFQKILIFGTRPDKKYLEEKIIPLVDGHRVQYKGVFGNKQAMYDMITDVYHSSVHESWGYISEECRLTGTKFHGLGGEKRTTFILPKHEIIDIWKRELEI